MTSLFPAGATWTRNVPNPVLSPTAAWETTSVSEPHVIVEGGVWRMWYRGGWATLGVGYATSLDGITWTKYAANPVYGLGGSGMAGNDGGQPWVLKVGATYWLYATNNDIPRVNVATSSDGIAWATQVSSIAFPSAGTLWGNRVVWQEGAAWKMLQEVHIGVWEIFLYTSTDGLAWTIGNGGNPLSSLRVAPGGMYGGPDLRIIGDLYHLWYHAAPVAGNLPTNIYHATSTDLINWSQTGIVLEHLGSGFEFDQVADPQIVTAPNGDAYLFYDGDDNVPPEGASIGLATAPGPQTGTRIIETWVTDPAGTYVAHLDRSAANPFRNFAVSRTRGADPGAGSLEHHLDNDLTRDGTLLADGNLVFMRYRGRTMAWVIEQREVVLDEQEHQTDWVKVSGRGAKQLLADRLVWPSKFSETSLDPALWDAGAWKTTLDGSAASGQKVVPVTSTVGAVVNDPVQLTGGGNAEVGIIASINAGVSVTLVDDLGSTYAAGTRIASAARQWRRFVNRAAGEMLWDLIDESNPRPGFAQITRGTIETTGADGWTQDLRFDNLLDVVEAVSAVHGEVDMDGLVFNYYTAPGSDRSAKVIFEEGADLLQVSQMTSDRDTITWAVAEGVGEGVISKLAVAKDTTATRRREGYIDAKDAGNLPLVQLRADAVISEMTKADGIAVEVAETRYLALTDYDLHDTVRVIAPSRGIDKTAVIVALYLKEDGDRVRVGFDLNTRRQEYLLQLAEDAKSIAQSVGVRNRMPQGNLVPFSFSGADIFDSTDTMDVFVFVPDRMYVTIESRALIRFREFFTGAKSASSGGGSTSGASSSSSSGASSASTSGAGNHSHMIGSYNAAGPGAYTNRRYDGASINFNLETVSAVDIYTVVEDPGGSGHAHGMAHTHGIAHTHSTPNHTHALVYGVFKEAYPASHSVTLKVYELEASAWVLRGTIPSLTADIEDVDLTAFLTGPGNWRLELKSDAAQPNGGRLGCDVSGYVLGAIQSS